MEAEEAEKKKVRTVYPFTEKLVKICNNVELKRNKKVIGLVIIKALNHNFKISIFDPIPHWLS